jgi:hypothetical protein
VVDLVTGRLRWYRHLLIAGLGAVAAWAWFGGSGLVPVLLWAWHRQPRPGRVRRVTVGQVTRARLGLLRTVAVDSRGARLEVFRDELPAEHLATLRRSLKSACSARDWPQDVEPV